MKRGQIAVIGGGITGLSAAHGLLPWAREQQVAVTLFESQSRLGGVIQTVELAGVPIEAGPDSLLTRKPDALNLIRSLGLGDQLLGLNPGAHGAYIFHRNRLHPIPAGLVAGVPAEMDGLWRTGLLSWFAKARALGDLFLPAAQPEDDMALGRLLRYRFGNQVVDRIATPILSGIYAGDIDALSLQATAPQVAAWARQNKSLMRAAREAARGRQPARPPAPSLFMTVRSGLGRVVESLADSLSPVAVRLNTPIRRVEPMRSGGFRLQTAAGDRERFDAVILSTPAWAAAPLLDFSVEVQNRLMAVPYTDLALVLAVYRPQDISLPLDKTGFLVPPGEGVAMTAATWVRSKWDYPTAVPWVPIRTFYGRASAPVNLNLSDADMLQSFQQDLARVMGVRRDPVEARVIRIPAGMPQYLVGHIARIQELRERLKSWPGLYLAGAAYEGVGIPDCVRQGQSAAKALMADWTRPGVPG
ncbi:MAG: protoporphyrinogen oxidase [Thermaerobacter sp.]|nr:protoporphyrinogen oxidase [Thermaerobacter sp.]